MIRVFTIVAGLAVGTVPASAGQPCAHADADAMRQHADLLLFGVDVGLLTSDSRVSLPKGMWGAIGEPYTHADLAANTEHWLYMAFDAAGGKSAGRAIKPSVSLSFNAKDVLNKITVEEAACDATDKNVSQVTQTALHMQRQRLEAAVDLAQRCACVTRDLLQQLANWKEEAPTDLPPPSLNLFQSHVSLGPDIAMNAVGGMTLTAVQRDEATFGHVPIGELASGSLNMRLESSGTTTLTRALRTDAW